MDARFADAELATFIAQLNAQVAPLARDAGAAALRAGTLERAAARPKGPEMADVRDLAVTSGALPARLYRPTLEARALLVYLHGGGWVIGDLTTHDRACRRLAAASGVAVLALDYRRAPEHPWPAAVDDTVEALEWIATRPPELGFAPTRVGVGGDSAGGTLATLACLRLRDSAPEAMPAAQFLLYANADLSDTGLPEKAHGFGLDAADIEWFAEQWVPDAALRADPRVSPLRAPDLSGLPPAVIVTCEHDPLRAQGESYAHALRDAGVPVTLRREEGMVHNFLLWDLFSPACAAAADRVAADVAALLA